MRVFGLDVEMVEVAPRRRRSAARVSLVANNLQCVYDKYVRQDAKVLSYNTRISGITENMLVGGKLLKNVRADVLRILRNSTVVGHSIHHDLGVLKITYDDLEAINCIWRDTVFYSRFRWVRQNRTTPSLKELVNIFLGRDIQKGAHSSVEDARAVVELYKRYRDEWEEEIAEEESDSEESESDDNHNYNNYNDNRNYYYDSSSSSDY